MTASPSPPGRDRTVAARAEPDSHAADQRDRPCPQPSRPRSRPRRVAGGCRQPDRPGAGTRSVPVGSRVGRIRARRDFRPGAPAVGAAAGYVPVGYVPAPAGAVAPANPGVARGVPSWWKYARSALAGLDPRRPARCRHHGGASPTHRRRRPARTSGQSPGRGPMAGFGPGNGYGPAAATASATVQRDGRPGNGGQTPRHAPTPAPTLPADQHRRPRRRPGPARPAV